MGRRGIIAVARLALVTSLLTAAKPLRKAHCSTPRLQHLEVAEGESMSKAHHSCILTMKLQA